MTRALLIFAGPTRWDVEGRLGGDQGLPLEDSAVASIDARLRALPHLVTCVYRCKADEASDRVARLVASIFKLRPRDNDALREMNLGLWQGLRAEEVKFRYPSVFEHWEEHPLAVWPPEGEGLYEAIHRVGSALEKILRRNRGVTVALALRPIAMQIAAGILRGQGPEQIAGHLHNRSPMETIEVSDEVLHRIIGWSGRA